MTMGITITTLDQLDTAAVQQIHAELTQLLQEKHPEVELSRGVVHDLVLYFSAVFTGRDRAELRRYLSARSLKAIEENPDLADTELADHIFANYRISRKAGVHASGTITVVVSADVTTIIPAGAVFTANGLRFVVANAYVARATHTLPTGPYEVGLTPQGNGTYAFSVPATCATEGPTGNLRLGTKLVPESPPGNFVTAYAGSDFSGGASTETNAEILTRMAEGIAAKAWSNTTNIVAMLRSQPMFSQTLDFSLIGYGYPEQRRDQHGVVPLSGGGRTDLYARTAPLPLHQTLRKTATLVEITAAGSIWQVSFDRDDAPGFYEVVKVLLPGESPNNDGFALTMDSRGYDLFGSGHRPDIVDAAEAAYSCYQTAVIRFLDTTSSTTSLVVGSSTADYDVVVSAMPLIKDLQEFCLDWRVRDPGGDCLVRAPIPCFLTINLDIQQAQTESSPDTDAIRTALADTVNNLGFPGQLHTSTVTDAVHDFLTTRQAIRRVELHGRIRRPDGQTVYLRDANRLQIPDDPQGTVTGRTTAFILDPANIGISVYTEGFTTRL